MADDVFEEVVSSPISKKPFLNMHKLRIEFRINTLLWVTMLRWYKTLEAFRYQSKVSSLGPIRRL